MSAPHTASALHTAATGSLPWLCPFTVAIDTREQLPFTFVGLRTDSDRGCRPITVPVQASTIPAGDYSIVGHEAEIAVERKGLSDLFGSFGKSRHREKRKYARLAAMPYAAYVVEADWAAILGSPPEFSQLPPKIVYRTVLHWQQQFPTVHWWMCANRRMAEITTFRILEAWWKRHHQSQQTEEGVCTNRVANPNANGAVQQIAQS